MWMKRILAILLSIMILLMLPLNTYASDWIVMLRDADDCRMLTDIKEISFKDDGNKWSFKAESYCCWELNYFKLSLTIFINLSGTKRRLDSDYFLEVQSDGEYAYKGYFYNLKTNEVTEIGCDFEKDNSIGTISVNKNLMKLPNSTFSVSAFIFNLVERPGTYVDAVPDDQHMIPFEFTKDPPLDKIEVSQQEINLGVHKIPKRFQTSFQVMNLGINPVVANLSSSSPYLSMDFDHVTLGGYEEQKIIITLITEKLTPKVFLEKVSITSEFGNIDVTIKFELVLTPLIKLSLSRIDFGTCFNGDKKTEKIIISNQFKGRIQGTVTTYSTWVGLSIFSFTTTSEVELTVSLKALNLAAKVYDGSITIVSDGGTIGIPIHMEILDTVLFDKKEINFGKIDIESLPINSMALLITNNTDQPLLLDFTKTVDWFEIDPSPTKLSANEKKVIKVKLIPEKMKEVNQQYQGTLTIDVPFSIYQVNVKAFVSQIPPLIQWLTDVPNQQEIRDKLVMGNSWEEIVRITNQGKGVLAGSAKWEQSNSSFRLFNFKFSLQPGELHEFKIKFDASGSKPDVYKNKLLIESNGGNLVIPCSIEVLPLPDQWVIIQLFIGKTTALINDQAIKLESPPYITKGTTMVPLRFISEAFKAKTEWFSVGKGRILISLAGKEIMLDIGKPVAYINGDKLLLQAAPEIKNGRTFVPVRFIAEAFGATVEWISKDQMIRIKMKDKL